MKARYCVWMMGLVMACGSRGADAADGGPTSTVDDAFWSHWGDGKAELNGYRLTTPRYGDARNGRMTLIFVTETFTDGQRVKSDGGHTDEYPVLKLNAAMDYQTGIYDYNVMTSTFLRIDGAARLGVPVKTSMSMQEWCGHVYEQVIPEGDTLQYTSHSYFDGEADRQLSVPIEKGGVVLDALPILVRGLVGDLAAGTYPALPTLVSGRYAHTATPAWTSVTVSRSKESVQVTVPAGEFRVVQVTTEVDGVRTVWSVEAAAPHHLVRWERSDGEVAELLGTDRIAYWKENRPGAEALLPTIGLPVPQW